MTLSCVIISVLERALKGHDMTFGNASQGGWLKAECSESSSRRSDISQPSTTRPEAPVVDGEET
jgi:hypothetical protein